MIICAILNKKNNMKKNKIILGIEVLGGIVLMFVCLALISSAVVFPDYLQQVKILIYSMFFIAMAVATMTIFRTGKYIKYSMLTVGGILLLILGASVAYLVPEFFHWAINFDTFYWLVVSIYSIPAICIEGGIFTLFIVFLETSLSNRSKREKYLIVTCFALYATLTVTTNFLTINGVITVDSHILFSRIVSAVAMIVAGSILYFENKTV